ncbi:hypothetical protein BDV98DRAFT_425295 [Pterulicium gracile]|uniref:Uncharacterized protein n=1 Tax=Pterulicium gracile TaxID=1884261 RepID=A0A5C3QPB5_9AGAR|nr:hypothetical protein BDV98DRAFT_425295 [Pterula gracilis]
MQHTVVRGVTAAGRPQRSLQYLRTWCYSHPASMAFLNNRLYMCSPSVYPCQKLTLTWEGGVGPFLIGVSTNLQDNADEWEIVVEDITAYEYTIRVNPHLHIQETSCTEHSFVIPSEAAECFSTFFHNGAFTVENYANPNQADVGEPTLIEEGGCSSDRGYHGILGGDRRTCSSSLLAM